MLVGSEGKAFLADARAAGKEVCVWTVNDPQQMKVAISWGVRAVLTDTVKAFMDLKKEVSHAKFRKDEKEASCAETWRKIVEDPSKLQLSGLSRYLFSWSHFRYYSLFQVSLDPTLHEAFLSSRYFALCSCPITCPD